MFNKILDWLCSSRTEVYSLRDIIKGITSLNSELKNKINILENIIADKRIAIVDTANKIAVTDHAVYRYKERFKNKNSHEEIRKMLHKQLLRQLYTMDTLPDGTYHLSKGVLGRVVNNTLVTIIFNRNNATKPKLKGNK